MNKNVDNKKIYFYVIIGFTILDLIIPFCIQIIYDIDNFKHRTIIFMASLIPFLISIIIALIIYFRNKKSKNNLPLFILRIILIILFFSYFMIIMCFAFYLQSDDALERFEELYGQVLN